MARIADLLAAGRTTSFEFFPPKNDEEQAALVRTLRDLAPLRPSFVSVTYRGGRASRDRTTRLVAGLRSTTDLVPMAHLICVAHSRLELADILVQLRKDGVENLMALGGDPVESGPDEGEVGELEHAEELVELARAIGGFSIGVAAHPDVHPRSPDRETDRRFLAAKLARADFAITQFFWTLDSYLSLVEDLRALGVDKPVLPGVMPLTSVASAPRFAAMGGPVPPQVLARFEGASPADQRRIGIDHMVELCAALLAEGAPGLHFYTLNQSPATREIAEQLGLQPAGA